MSEAFDVVVAGAGPVGLAFALSMRGSGQRIALVDPQPARALAEPGDDGREIALTDRSVAMLRGMGAWARIPAGELSPLRRMRVLNGPSYYAMHFGAGPSPAGDGTLGRFAPNRWLRRALFEAAAEVGDVTVRAGRRVERAAAEGGLVTAELDDGTRLRARLLVAADTRRSRLRAQAGIGAATHDYGQTMMVCPVSHPVPHEETATAWFEYGRTLVTLPLNGGRSSAVLTLANAEAQRLRALDDAALGTALTGLYRNRLGPMLPVGARHAVPVVTSYARRFAARRLALLGDAAVAMHPTTAHGFNFGLLGQEALAGALREGLAAGREIGDERSLARYEARHRGETRLFFTAAEAIMRLYAAGDSGPARLLRDAGLRIGNLPPLRRVLQAQMRDADWGAGFRV